MVVEYLPPYQYPSVVSFALNLVASQYGPRQSETRLLNTEMMDLRAVLVGHDLFRAFYGRRKPIYLVLILPDRTGDFQYEAPKLRDCLHAHVFDKNTNEFTCKNSDIVLNIDNCIRCGDSVKADPKKIFSRKTLSSAYLVWGDRTLHRISRKDVIGVKEKVTKKRVEFLCAVVLSDKRWRWNQVFVATDCPPRLALSRFNPAKRPITQLRLLVSPIHVIIFQVSCPQSVRHDPLQEGLDL